MAARRCRERAYLDYYRTGHFGFEYTYSWIARDAWGNTICSGKTRKECEAECRRRAYVPVRA